MLESIDFSKRFRDCDMTLKEFAIQYALGSLTWQQLHSIAFNPCTNPEILLLLRKNESDLISGCALAALRLSKHPSLSAKKVNSIIIKGMMSRRRKGTNES